MPEAVYEKILPVILKEWDKFGLPKVDKSKLKVKVLPFRKSGLHSMLCFLFSEGENPLVVAKMPRNREGDLAFAAVEHEHELLSGVKAVLPGNIPELYGFQRIGGVPVLFFKAYAGEMFNLLLDREENLDSLNKLLDRGAEIAQKLGVGSKIREGKIDERFVQKWIKNPFESIKKVFPEVNPKIDLSMMGEKYPVVAAHQEFNPWNMITDEKGGLIVFDWEDGTLEGVPFIDLYNYYMICYRILLVGETDKSRQRSAEARSKRVELLIRNHEAFAAKYCGAVGVPDKMKDFFFQLFALNIVAFFIAEKRMETEYARSWLPLLVSAPPQDAFVSYVKMESKAFLGQMGA